MKNSFSILIIVLLYSNSIYTKDLDFKDGFKKGYGMGYCKEDRLKDPSFDCRVYHPFRVSIPEPQEGKDSYEDGYEIGYNKGMEDYKSNISQKSNFDWTLIRNILYSLIILWVVVKLLIKLISLGYLWITFFVLWIVTFLGGGLIFRFLGNPISDINFWIGISFVLTIIIFYILGNYDERKFQKNKEKQNSINYKNSLIEYSKKFNSIKKEYRKLGTKLDSEKILNDINEEFDKNKNGVVDLFEVKGEINQLIHKHKDLIVERGLKHNQNFINNFVRVENYLNDKSNNINDLLKRIIKEIKDCSFYKNEYDELEIQKKRFEKILKVGESEVLTSIKNFNEEFGNSSDNPNKFFEFKIHDFEHFLFRGESWIKETDSYKDFLRDEIHSYNLILYHSLHLINSIVEDDLHTFNIIYERLDKLNIFNTNWENEVSEKLTQIEFNLGELVKEVRHVGQGIINSIQDLTFVTEKGNDMLSDKLGEINSGINVNNLLTGINTYQLSKINSNTKSLRSKSMYKNR